MHLQETLQHYTQIIRNRFRFILLGVAFGSTVTFIVSLFIPPVYQASALVKVNSVLTTTVAPGNDVFSAQAQAVSYAILVTSPEVLQEAAKRLPGMTVEQLKNMVSDSPVTNTQLIEVRAHANHPRRAADIANAVATTFVHFQETKERTRLQKVVDKLAQNLVQVKIDIDIAQQELTTLQNTQARQDRIAQQQSLLATYQSTYNALLTSHEHLQAQEQQTANMLSVGQQAQPPSKPTSPQIVLNTVLAASMSLLLMIVLALLQDWLDVTIKTADDVVRLAALEPLGSIPIGTSITRLFDLRSEHTDEVKEAYSMLGISLRMLRREERTIVVTSPRSGAGTTATATYLALSLAQSGMRVLLVDANVRRPSLHNVFLRPDTHGLADSLQNVHSFQESSTPLPHLWLNQWKTDIPNLWLLPAGPVGPYPGSLLRQPALVVLRDRLLGRIPDTSEQLQPGLVDIIIFDTAALEEGTDAYLLAAIADATVLIVEAGKEHRDMLHRLSVTFQRLGAPILGVVVNRQQKQYRSYFYAPRQISIESLMAQGARDGNENSISIGRKVVAPLSADQPPFLSLPQAKYSSAPEQTVSQEIQQSSAQEHLPLQPTSEPIRRQFKTKSIQLQQEHLSLQLSTSDEYTHTRPLVAFALPETPQPLPLICHDSSPDANAQDLQTNGTRDNPPRLQFAPLLRLSGTVSQGRSPKYGS